MNETAELDAEREPSHLVGGPRPDMMAEVDQTVAGEERDEENRGLNNRTRRRKNKKKT